MKKFFIGMTAAALMSTCFTVGAFAQSLSEINVNKPLKIGPFSEQKGATIDIVENENNSWGDEFSFELKLPGDVKWNKKTSVNSMFKTQIDGNVLKITGKTNPNAKDKIFIVPYIDIDRRAQKGDLTVLIKTNVKGDTGETVKIAEISDYAISMTSSYEKAPINSKKVPVEVTLSEDVENSIVPGVLYTLSVENSKIDPESVKVTSLSGYDKVEVKGIHDNYIDLEFEKKGSAKNQFNIAFDITPKVGYSGEILASIEGRGINNDSIAIAKIYKGLEIAARTPDVLELGAKNQKISDVVFTETEAGGFEKGNYTLRLDPAYKGFEFEKASFNVLAGNIRVASPTIKGNEISFRIKGDSTEISKIELANVTAVLDRFGYDGVYKLELVNDKAPNEVIASIDLFKVNPAASAKSLKFKIGNKAYTVTYGANTETKQLLAAPYISKDKKTMLPLRAIGEALDAQVDWEGISKTITIKSGTNKTILITLGNKNMIVDGKPVKMTSPAVAKDGTTFLPVRDVAEALDAQVDWDNQEKSATVTKK